MFVLCVCRTWIPLDSEPVSRNYTGPDMTPCPSVMLCLRVCKLLLTVFIYWVCPPYVLTNEAYQINLKTIRLLIHLRFFFSEEYFTGKDTTLCSNLKHQASNKRLRSLCCLRIHFYVVIFLPSWWHHSNCPGNVFICDHSRISLAIVLRLRCC